MSNNGPLNGSIRPSKAARGNANKIGALFDRNLDTCPHTDAGLCLVAHNKDRIFQCEGGQFQGCTVFIRLKNGGAV